MKTEAISTLIALRDQFYAEFGTAMQAPLDISKKNSEIYNASLVSVASWEDARQRQNYMSIYAYSAPDILSPERPFLLRLSINQWQGTSGIGRQKKLNHQLNQDWSFVLTVLPDELIDFAPWVVSWIESQENKGTIEPPPSRLIFIPQDAESSTHAWTEAAWWCLEQDQSQHHRIPVRQDKTAIADTNQIVQMWLGMKLA